MGTRSIQHRIFVAVQVRKGLPVEQSANEFAFVSQSELRNEGAHFANASDLNILPDISCALPGGCFVFCRSDDAISVSHPDRKSTRLNSSHVAISYAVFCLKKKKKKRIQLQAYKPF